MFPVLDRLSVLYQMINAIAGSRNPLLDLSDLPDLTEMLIMKNIDS